MNTRVRFNQITDTQYESCKIYVLPNGILVFVVIMKVEENQLNQRFVIRLLQKHNLAIVEQEWSATLSEAKRKTKQMLQVAGITFEPEVRKHASKN